MIQQIIRKGDKMAEFKANAPFNVAFYLLKPSSTMIKGVPKKVYAKSNTTYYCNFRTFGGTEKIVNGITVVEDTATVQTWFDPEIKSDCMLEIEGQQYEILGTPENINMRNQFLEMKVRAVKGGV